MPFKLGEVYRLYEFHKLIKRYKASVSAIIAEKSLDFFFLFAGLVISYYYIGDVNFDLDFTLLMCSAIVLALLLIIVVLPQNIRSFNLFLAKRYSSERLVRLLSFTSKLHSIINEINLLFKEKIATLMVMTILVWGLEIMAFLIFIPFLPNIELLVFLAFLTFLSVFLPSGSLGFGGVQLAFYCIYLIDKDFPFLELSLVYQAFLFLPAIIISAILFLKQRFYFMKAGKKEKAMIEEPVIKNTSSVSMQWKNPLAYSLVQVSRILKQELKAKYMNAVYYDMLDVKDDIKSFVNIERFGDLYYKKMTLLDHSKKLFEDNEIKVFYRITNKSELAQVIDKLAYAPNDDFIFISSNLVIIDKESFALFLKKIKYIDSALALCGPDCIKPLMKMPKKEILQFLNQLNTNGLSLYETLMQKADGMERFSQEYFYHEIKSYPDFVSYLQSNFELRYFNSIKVLIPSLQRDRIKKKTMLKEYSFYSVLPDEMKLYFLPPFQFKEHENYAEYSMEKLHILDVSVQWIHFSLSINQFKGLMSRLLGFVETRKALPFNSNINNSMISDSLYLNKLDDRVKDFKETKVFKFINDVVANSTKYKSFDEIIEKYKRLYKTITTKEKHVNVATLSHGDLCFSNILYDKRIDFLKLIDPKGCVQEKDGYMDSLYDVAKLSHSVMGNYDFINNGIFEIKYDNELQVYLEIPSVNQLVDKKELFAKILHESGYSYKRVRLYESSLFLSMLPLHIDYPKKVLAFVLTAITILEELDVE